MRYLSIFTFCLFSFFCKANDVRENLGKVSRRIKLKVAEDRVYHLVANSEETRRLMKGRYLAGETSKEEYWAKEYEKVMKDESNEKDYLELALELQSGPN